MAEANEPRADAVEAPASSPSPKAKSVKHDAKHLKTARSASQEKKRGAAATARDRTLPAAQAGAASPPAVARAEELMDRAGERVGQFLRSGQQLPRKIALAREAPASSSGEAEGASAAAETGAEPAPAVARAEELMDRAGERLGRFVRFGGQQAQRSLALAREAAEDLLAEAESIRRGDRSHAD